MSIELVLLLLSFQFTYQFREIHRSTIAINFKNCLNNEEPNTDCSSFYQTTVNFLNLYPSVINKIGSDGRLYVTTIGSPFELNVYTKSLTLVSSYQLPPGPNYQSATIDSKSNLYVQSNEPKVLSVYDKSGKLVKSIDVGIKPESIFADGMGRILVSEVSDNGDKVVNVIVNGTVTKSVKINGGSVGGITAANQKFFVAQFNKNVIESYDY